MHSLYISCCCCECHGNLSIYTWFVQLEAIINFATRCSGTFFYASLEMTENFQSGSWLCLKCVLDWMALPDMQRFSSGYHTFENALTENRNKISITYYKWRLFRNSVLIEDMALNKMKETLNVY